MSLIAATLRWLEYAERRSVLVVSRDGYVLWSRSSKSALKTGAFYRTVNRPPIAVPALSLAAQTRDFGIMASAEHQDAWFGEPAMEISLASDSYDFVISLIHLDEAVWNPSEEALEPADVFDVMQRG